MEIFKICLDFYRINLKLGVEREMELMKSLSYEFISYMNSVGGA